MYHEKGDWKGNLCYDSDSRAAWLILNPDSNSSSGPHNGEHCSAAGAFVGTHAIGNLAGGAGDYLNVLDGGSRDWNVTRQGYENLTDYLCGDPSIGTKAFYLTDAAIGAGAMATPVKASQSLPMGIERYYTQPSVFQAGATTVVHDSAQVLMSTYEGVSQ